MPLDRDLFPVNTLSTGYQSSPEKDIVRKHFDLPLLRKLHQRKRQPLSYFGLPGAEALDIKTWRELIGYIDAVERHVESLQQLENVLNTQYPDIRYRTHWGEMDQVILRNVGKPRSIDGEYDVLEVSNCYDEAIGGNAWEFDVVYLDYFGTFLPLKGDQISPRTWERSKALRRLFDADRLDARGSWILIITVESMLYKQSARSILRDYLRETRESVSSEIRDVLDYLLGSASDPGVEAAQLIHGATASLVSAAANSANLEVQPRGTVLYEGFDAHPMIHLAFEFSPRRQPLSGSSNLMSLLLAPMLRPKNTDGAPGIELLPRQHKGVTKAIAQRCLEFLDSTELYEVVQRLPD